MDLLWHFLLIRWIKISLTFYGVIPAGMGNPDATPQVPTSPRESSFSHSHSNPGPFLLYMVGRLPRPRLRHASLPVACYRTCQPIYFGYVWVFSGLIIELPYGSDALNVNTLAGRASWIGHELASPEFAWQISRNKDFSHIEGSPNKARLNSGKITSFEIKRSNQNRWDCKM